MTDGNMCVIMLKCTVDAARIRAFASTRQTPWRWPWRRFGGRPFDHLDARLVDGCPK